MKLRVINYGDNSVGISGFEFYIDIVGADDIFIESDYNDRIQDLILALQEIFDAETSTKVYKVNSEQDSIH